MKLVRRKKQETNVNKASSFVHSEGMPGTGSDFYDANTSSWKVLIVDDEPDVHAITKLSLKNFSFANKSIEFLNH